MLNHLFYKENPKIFWFIFLLIAIAGLAEAAFVLILKQFAQTLSQQSGISNHTVIFFLSVLLFFGIIRSIAQGFQSTLSVNTVFFWIDKQRVKYINSFIASAYPAYRFPDKVRESLDLRLEQARTGLLAWFATLLASVQLILLLPLLLLFPLQLSLAVFVLILPVLLLSKMRIKTLRKSSQKWLKDNQTMQSLIINFNQRLEWILGNKSQTNKLHEISKALAKTEVSHQKWLTLQLVFPQTMELLFFVFIAVITGLLFLLGQASQFPTWQLLPFTLLLLLLYKPLREWARHYPHLSHGKEAWTEFQQNQEKMYAFPKIRPFQFIGKSICIKNITFEYSRAKPVFRSFSLSFSPNEITGLQGPNGSGKTTLLRLITQLEMPQPGSIVLPEKWKNTPKPLFTYHPQQIHPDLEFIVKKFSDTERAHPSIRRIIKTLELESVLLKCRHSESLESVPLSGGEQQRLNLALTFTSNARYLLLDEPAVWLPAHRRAETMKRLISDWIGQGEKGLLIATHEPEILQLCNKVLVLKKV